MKAKGITALKLFDEAKPFYKGNMHLHTTGSDGQRTPEEAIALYKAQGYDFLSITDHRVITRETGFDGNMLLIAGVEWDYLITGGQAIHIVGVGVGPLAGEIDRIWGPQRCIDVIRASGGRAILAHPAWSMNTNETICGLHDLTAAEVYNTFSGAPWNANRADSSLLLDIAAASGTYLPFVASDDTHRYTGEQFGGFTMVQADSLTEKGILDGLDRGTFYASQGPQFKQIEYDGDIIRITCSPVERIIFFSELTWLDGRCRDGHGMTESVYEIQRHRYERYVRCQIWDAEGKTAWTSPIRTM